MAIACRAKVAVVTSGPQALLDGRRSLSLAGYAVQAVVDVVGGHSRSTALRHGHEGRLVLLAGP